MLSQEQKNQLNLLVDYRDQIDNAIFHIQHILKTHFPSEFDDAYQHYIPQIITALHPDDRWLSRGQISMKYTIDRITDQMQKEPCDGVSKYIK